MTVDVENLYAGLPVEIATDLEQRFRTMWDNAGQLPTCSGCGAEMERAPALCCPRCWRSLPQVLRDAVKATRSTPRDDAGRAAREAVLVWLKGVRTG